MYSSISIDRMMLHIQSILQMNFHITYLISAIFSFVIGTILAIKDKISLSKLLFSLSGIFSAYVIALPLMMTVGVVLFLIVLIVWICFLQWIGFRMSKVIRTTRLN